MIGVRKIRGAQPQLFDDLIVSGSITDGREVEFIRREIACGLLHEHAVSGDKQMRAPESFWNAVALLARSELIRGSAATRTSS